MSGLGRPNQQEEVEEDGSARQWLQDLKEQNQQRQARLDELKKEYQEILSETPTAADNKQETYTTEVDLATKISLLQVELDILQNPQFRREQSELEVEQWFPSAVVDPDDNSMASAVYRNILMQRFGRDILQSYQSLSTLVEHRGFILQREQTKLAQKKDFLQQQQELLDSMQQEIKQLSQKKHSDGDIDSNPTETAQRQLQSLQEENQTAKSDLRYICDKLQPSKKMNSNQSASKKKTKKKRVQLEHNSTQASSQKRPRTSSGSECSVGPLEFLLMKLTARLLQQNERDDGGNNDEESSSVPKNSYLDLKSLMQENNNNHDMETLQQAAKILCQCFVAEAHPDNPDQIFLTDYRR